MPAAGEAGLPFVVCDRPNPITGLESEGNRMAAGFESFVGVADYPMRHAMTAGELALPFHGKLGWGRELRVVRMEGWRRGMGWEKTRLPSVLPPPERHGRRHAPPLPGNPPAGWDQRQRGARVHQAR